MRRLFEVGSAIGSLGALLACAAFAQSQNASGVAQSYSATSVNVATSDKVRIDLMRWSSDAERNALVRAWTDPESTNAAKGKGGADNTDPFGSFGRNRQGAADDDPAAVPAPAAAPARGGRGGRGGAPPAKKTPEAALTETIGKAPTIGYLWTSEVAGYSIHYAARIAQPDGSERLVLLTDRRLGASNDAWKTTAAASTDYPFSLIEIRIPAKGDGEGKISATAKVTVDSAAKTLALENYSGTPVILQGIKRQAK